jgi:hypothetical protein
MALSDNGYINDTSLLKSVIVQNIIANIPKIIFPSRKNFSMLIIYSFTMDIGLHRDRCLILGTNIVKRF